MAGIGFPTDVSVATEQPAHHVPEYRAGSATTAAAAIMPATAAAVMGVMRTLVTGILGRGNAGGDDLRQQRLVLHGVEVAGLRISAGCLPAGDHGPGCVVELAGRLGVEA